MRNADAHGPNDQQLTSPLQFVTLYSDRCEFLALVDTGAQLNLISEDLLEKVRVEKALSSTILRLRGVDNSCLEISKWVCVKFILSNGTAASVPFAVVKSPQSMIILGLPFLKDVKARVDPTNRMIETYEGPLQLLEGCRTGEHSTLRVIRVEIDSLVSKAILSAAGKAVLKRLLRDHAQLYEHDRRGQVRGLTHHIRLTTLRPIASRPRSHAEEHEKAIDEEVKKMLEAGVIQASDSPYSSEVVMVEKKTGDWRVCVDYRALNRVTVDDKYQIPRITELLFSVKGSKYFAALDLRSGYWQIPMDESSRRYTAFRAPSGLYEFLVMPFGLKNAPATFQRSMDFILGDLRYKNVLTYLDDILIHHVDEDECLKLLGVVFARLRAAGLTINLPKCIFFPSELKYLGHVIRDGYLRPDSEKVEVLRYVKAPKTVTELRALLGMIGYFQNYLPNYASTIMPLTDLLRGKPNSKKANKKTPIKWTGRCRVALEKLIGQLKESALSLPQDEDRYVIETDASDKAIGGVLTVERTGGRQPAFFVSKKLSGAQLNWAIREKEAFAIIHCLQKFDRFVRPKRFDVITDNQSLKWLFDAKSGKLARWAVLMSEYNMVIKWRKGGENAVADYFSRHIDFPDPVEDRMIYNVTIDDDLLPSISEVIDCQKQCETPRDRGYLVRGKRVYYRGGLWVPETMRKRVIASCHILPPLCHPGIKRTKRIVLKAFNWPNLHTDVTEYVKGCLVCQRMRSDKRHTSLLPHNPYEGIFSVLHIDFWECTYQGRRIEMLTMIDAFSRWVEAEIVPNKLASTVASSLMRNWICRFGIPKRLVSDNEATFVSDLLKRLAASLGIKKITTIPYRPQGNAPVEAFHRTLNKLSTLR